MDSNKQIYHKRRQTNKPTSEASDLLYINEEMIDESSSTCDLGTHRQVKGKLHNVCSIPTR